MKKIFVMTSVAALLTAGNSARAIDLVLSKNNLRLNNTANSTSFTVTLSDDIAALTGSGSIPVKLKIKSPSVSASTQTILIPYTDGVIGNSDEITLSLNKELEKSASVKLSIIPSATYRKKYKVNKLSKTLNLDLEAIKLSGRVTVPTADLNSFKARTAKKLKQAKGRFITPFNTENPEGVVVELYEINPDSGEPVGEPLAQTITDAEGNYTMEMPPAADFGPDFALIVENDADETMHAPLFSDEVPINPATEALFDLTQEAIENPEAIGLTPMEEVNFDNFNELELENLNDKFEELNPVYEETLSDSVDSLKERYSTFLNNMLGFAADDETTGVETDLSEVAEGVAGDYNVTFFDGSIATRNQINVSVELAAGRMSKPDEVGALTVTPFPSFSTRASLFEFENREGPGNGECQGPDCGDNQGPNNGECQGPDCGDNQEPISVQNSNDSGCFEIEASVEAARDINGTDESGNFYMTVDSARVISFAEPAHEETHEGPDGTSVFRSLPGVMHMIPVGEDMFLSASTYAGESISPSGESEFDYDAGFGSIIKKSKITEGDLAGDYGLVGLGNGIGSSAFSVSSMIGTLSFTGTTVAYSVTDSYREALTTSCGSDSYVINSGDEQGEGTASLEFQGDRVSILVDDNDPSSETLFTGFARPDGEILTLVYASDSGARGSRIDFDGRTSNVIANADRKLIFAVRKPSSLVSLNGKAYRILSMNSSLNTQGGRIIESGDVGTLSFTGSTASVTGFTKTLYTKETASSTVSTGTATVNEAGFAYNLTDSGSITMTVNGEEWTGFVSSDTSLIILNVDEDNGLGMYLAILQE